MVATLLIWIYILFFSYIYGWTVIKLLVHFFRLSTEMSKISKPIIALTGLCAINTFAALLSLFISLGWFAQAIFLVLGLALTIRMWKQQPKPFSFKFNKLLWLVGFFFVLIFFTILINGIGAPSNPDTGIYHAQAIRWIETYPAVPGLGNLHSRFAYDSNWLVLNALFSFSFLGIRSFHVLPGAFLVITSLYFLEGAYALIKGKISMSGILKVCLIPLVFYLVKSQISSPGTDFPTIIWIWVTFSLLLETIENRKDHPDSTISIEEILVFLFSFFLITIKLSAIPILLLGAYIFFKYTRQNLRTPAKLILCAFIILAPWLTRNLILSGYWVYPVPFIAKLSPNFDWKIPLNNVTQDVRSIQAWARIPRADASYVLSLPLHSWLREWFGNLYRHQKILVAGAVLSPMLFGLSVIIGFRKKALLGSISFTYLVSYIGVLFWLFGAPDLRFGYGFIVITTALAGVPLVYQILTLIKIPLLQKTSIYLLVILLILYQAVVLYNSIDQKSLLAHIVLPADYSTLPTSPCQLHNYTLLCADLYNECWYNPFPCIPPGSANPQVEMRAETLRSGFRVINAP